MSLAGLALGVVSLGNIVLFTLIALMSGATHPYVGILAYMVAPAFLMLALFLLGAGLWRERRLKAVELPAEVSRFPRLDLNDPRQRNAALGFLAFLLIFVVVSMAGSYQAYQYTDSVQFCGLTCHTVMHPEYTAYELSPHARVACVECHVGAGATWYVKSKLSGTRQVFAAIFHTYPRPIPTPVHDLRPAQETCEQCHWPKKFYGAQLKVFTHYASDEKNTPRQIQMLIRTGGGDPATGAPEGIHWHMNIGNQLEYVSTDEKHNVIPYIHVRDTEGHVAEYYAKDSALTPEQIAKATRHRMDCVDCHNRPTHVYVPPDQAVDRSLLSRRLDVSLPYLKQQSVAVLTANYDSTGAALQGIARGLHDFYETKYPELARTKQLEIRNAVDEVQRIYQRTIFPEMKVNWETHPNNIGHVYFNGCFRCHDGQHVSADGKVIRKDCDACHTVLSQQEGAIRVISEEEHRFQHPVDIGDLTQVSCSDCHSGGASP
ncbi:MAG TPA: NapC/NirT family cytochrome c [Terriglobales bacterium]|nr:NapC/NirT family cytochrome c [Terriglobales bacterium]